MKFFIYIIFILINASVIFAQNGLVNSYHPNGIVAEENFYVKDVLDGISRSYYDNGVLKEEKNYMLGKLHGTYKTFYENGAPKEEYTIVDGKKDGISKEFYNNGGLKTLYVFEDGILKETKHFRFDATLPVPKVLTADEKYQIELEKYQKELEAYNRQVSAQRSSRSKRNEVVPPKNDKILDEEEENIFLALEEQPEPIGGMAEIHSKLIYPELAKRAGVEGTVVVNALVNEEGNVIKTNVLKSIGAGCDEAAERAISRTKFKPGKQRNKNVQVWVALPVVFKLK